MCSTGHPHGFYCDFTVKLCHLYVVPAFSPERPRTANAIFRTGKHFFFPKHAIFFIILNTIRILLLMEKCYKYSPFFPPKSCQSEKKKSMYLKTISSYSQAQTTFHLFKCYTYLYIGIMIKLVLLSTIFKKQFVKQRKTKL